MLITPIDSVRLRTSERAERFGRYPSSRIAASTRSRVSGFTRLASLSTRETV